MTFRKLAVVVALCVLPPVAFAASPVKPGKWQVTMETEMTGVPMKMPPVTLSHCITKEEAENPEAAIPQERKNGDCKVSDVKVDGNTVSWKMTCAKQQMTGDGQITYSGEAYTGNMKMTMPQNEINVKYTGKYLGACDK